ncbi:ATP synthase F0 subcomplex A subunit [Desulfotomaculum arcticum]|uniref:ATP synthase subunit a n=1 Tax=Desulfotruncus arcticus DSM 17038 TaxID=1121424 RepID=A0A1I2X2X1_9FIRM|nr:F0F1 ATP synthase subunit A [Desulfotruncus arcticus]SFH06271.1 ATP synthase F0 subcomplex A subunit [Desulfotomaculum arcticum] [Desulfotruncus arcticus DSM 17038]
MSAEAAHEASKDMLEVVHENLNIWGFPHDAVNFGLGPMDLKTLVMTWIVMALVILFTVAATRNMQLKRPGKLQLMVEEMYSFLKGLAYENLDPKKGASLMCLLFSLFIFLLFCNLWGLIPTMMSPTANVNTTLGMAIAVFILVQVLGLYYRKLSYFKHFVEPFVFFLPLVIIEELSKPLTLAFRLYGNIYAGEVLIAVLLGLIPFTINFFGGFIAMVVWLSFSIFVGFIQAFIFTMLTIAYIGQVTAEHH